MKRVFLLGFLLLSLYYANAQRQIINIDETWKFGSGSDSEVIQTDYNDSGWSTVDLPYSWNGFDGQDGGNNLYRGAKWYRKSILADNAWQGKKVFIKFGAANMKTDIYINGQKVGEHIGGYAAFIFDISEYLNYGSNNLIAVKVDNSWTIDAPPLSGDFSFFGGISRDVELMITEPVFISPLDYASPGVYITPYNISDQKADVNIKVLVGNHDSESQDVEVIAYIKDMEGVIIDTIKTNVIVNSNTVVTTSMDTEVSTPTLWEATKNPYLYSVEVNLRTNNTVTDQVIQPLGFRTYSVNDDTGFALNGEKYNLHGVCFHEDRPDIGRAISNAQRKEDLDILTEELGCTYLRLVHYQHDEYTYDYSDSVGIVLSTEVPLVNKISSSGAFTENSKSQLRELIKQNYNHPSILFWGMFNEVNFHSGPNPAPLVGQLNTLAHSLDSTRLTTGAAQNDEADTHWLLDVCGWNKYMGWYDGSFADYASWADWLRSRHPDTKIGMSEYGAGASIYHHQEVSNRPNPAGPFHPEEYQCDYHEAYYQAMLERPFIWSTAVWVAFDFASDYRNEGDAAGINDKGLVTRDRKVRKDAFYYYKANWKTDPFVHITSRRFAERTIGNTKVKVYSNCDSVELKVNNQTFNSLESNNHIFTWPDVDLGNGDNVIKVKGFANNQVFTDSCIWHFNKSANDTLMTGDIQINFQPGNSATPEGYLADDGAAFGDRGNGYSYGWTPANTSNTRERSFTSNQVFNTLNHIQKNGVNYTWEIAVDNGIYQVSVGCGDPDYTDSYHKILVEGELVLEGYSTKTAMKVATDTVTVTDGRITVMPATGSSNAKINLIHLTFIDSISVPEMGILNGSFELPANDLKFRADGGGGANVFNGNVPGWWADSKATDSGREDASKQAYDGTYTGFGYNNDGGSIWAMAGTVEEGMRDLSLSFYASESWPNGQTGVNIEAKFAVYEGTDPSTFTMLETLSQPFDPAQTDANGWENFIFPYTLPKSVEGKNLLIGYDISTESSTSSWFNFDDFTLVVSPVTGINNITPIHKSIEVYPNPTSGYLTMKMNNNNFERFSFYNVTGEKVLSGNINSPVCTIDVSSFDKGVYLLKVENVSECQVIETIVK